MSTKTRFEKEAKGNSEMVYSFIPESLGGRYVIHHVSTLSGAHPLTKKRADSGWSTKPNLSNWVSLNATEEKISRIKDKHSNQVILHGQIC